MRALLTLAAFAGMTLPTPALADETPPAARVERSARLELIVPGAVVFTASYGASVAVAYMHRSATTEGPQRGWKELYIPLVGPFLGMANGNDRDGKALLGAGQVIGAGLIAAGILFPRERISRSVAGITVTPVPAYDGGMALVGAF
jgi:hypothetical protein